MSGLRETLASRKLEKKGAFEEQVISWDKIRLSWSLTGFLCDTEHVALSLISAAFSLTEFISLKLLKRRDMGMSRK